MKNTFKVLGIIALVALIGFSMVSCSDDAAGGASYDGTWVGKNSQASGGNKEFTVTLAGDSIKISDGTTTKEFTLKDNIVASPAAEGTNIQKDIFDGEKKIGYIQYIQYTGQGYDIEELGVSIDDDSYFGAYVSLGSGTGNDLTRQ